MDIEKSRKFYQDRYFMALKQFGKKSLTASICKKKLEMLAKKAKQGSATESSSTTDNTTSDYAAPKEGLPTE